MGLRLIMWIRIFRLLPIKKSAILYMMLPKAMGVNVHRGLAWTTDALLRETKEIVEAKRKEGAIAVDMVSSTLLDHCQIYNVKAQLQF